MNSVNDSFDTASKVNLLEHQSSSPSPPQRRNRNLLKIFFCLVIFLALITGAILLYLIHENNVNSEIQLNSKQTNKAVQVFCSVTSHLPQCITSLSSSIPGNGRKKINPDDIFSVSLMLSSGEVNSLISLTKSLILISPESRSASALQQCARLIDDSLHKLNRSLSASAGFALFCRDLKILGQEKIRDMKVWVDGSLSDLRSCFDVLVKDESRAVDELQGRVQIAMIYERNNFEFLQKRDGIVDTIESWNHQSPETVVDYVYLTILCLFCPQYLVLVLLYFLLFKEILRVSNVYDASLVLS